MVDRDFATIIDLRGLALPATRGTGGYFESKGPFDVAWGDLLLVLLTPLGSRPLNRQFGSALHETLFMPQTSEFEIVKVAIRDAVVRWANHIIIKRVDVDTAEARKVRVGITFSLRTDSQQDEERAVLIDKTHISVFAGT